MGIIKDRAGFPLGENKSALAITLGETYVEWIKYLQYKDPLCANYMFVNFFEYTYLCGESGAHLYITELSFGAPQELNWEKPVKRTHIIIPTIAKLSIGLDEYDRLRLRRTVPKGFDSTITFPPYTRMEG